MGSIFVVSTVNKVENVSKAGVVKMTYMQDYHEFEMISTRPIGVPGVVEFAKWTDEIARTTYSNGMYKGRPELRSKESVWDVPIVNVDAPRGLSIFQEAYAY